MDNYSKVGGASLKYRVVGGLLTGVFLGLVFAIPPGIVTGLIFNSFEVGFSSIFIYWLLVGVLFVVLAHIEYRSIGYLIEDNTLSLKQGFFHVHKVTIPFSKITNVSMSQNILERMFSTGDVIVDQEDSEFRWKGIDVETADKIIKEISKKSNIQPIADKK